MTPHTFVPKLSEEETLALWERRVGIEQFLRELRLRGAFQVESILAVRSVAKVTLGEAKEIVHYSETWSDLRDSSDAIHDALYQAALSDGWVDLSAEPVTETMLKTGT